MTCQILIFPCTHEEEQRRSYVLKIINLANTFVRFFVVTLTSVWWITQSHGINNYLCLLQPYLCVPTTLTLLDPCSLDIFHFPCKEILHSCPMHDCFLVTLMFLLIFSHWNLWRFCLIYRIHIDTQMHMCVSLFLPIVVVVAWD